MGRPETARTSTGSGACTDARHRGQRARSPGPRDMRKYCSRHDAWNEWLQGVVTQVPSGARQMAQSSVEWPAVTASCSSIPTGMAGLDGAAGNSTPAVTGMWACSMWRRRSRHPGDAGGDAGDDGALPGGEAVPSSLDCAADSSAALSSPLSPFGPCAMLAIPPSRRCLAGGAWTDAESAEMSSFCKFQGLVFYLPLVLHPVFQPCTCTCTCTC